MAVKNAGDYCGIGVVNGNPAVAFLLPNARDENVHGGRRSICHCESPPHSFTEEPDGTLTIRASILSETKDGTWHGYLTKGEWSQC